MEFHAKVYEGYKILARREPQRFVSIDASGSKNEREAKARGA